MGASESSEAHGQTCCGCGIRLPPANPKYDFINACAGTNYSTYCFWTQAESKISITKSFNVSADKDGVGFSAGTSQTVEIGSRLFKYFRNANGGRYYCTKCWVVRDTRRTESVFLEICGRGVLITKDYELVKCGNF